MKANAIAVIGLASAATVYFALPQHYATAHPGGATPPGVPPVGRAVEVSVVAGNLSPITAGRVTGILVSLTGEWVVIGDGNSEHWIPTEKVMAMKASR